MSAFYIGQRVRILWSRNWPELAGCEGTIVPVPDYLPRFNNSRNVSFAVGPDCWGGKPYQRFDPFGTFWFGPRPENLEPILPPGLESPAEIAALYEPEDAIA